MFGKRLTAFALIIVIAFNSVVYSAVDVKAVPKVDALSYVIMDASSGTVIYSKNRNKKVYPASTTKIVTAMCVLDSLSLDKEIKFTSKMRKASHSYDIAHIDIPVGTVYTVEEYLYMMLMASDASSATALAIGTSGSIPAFAKKMNAKVKSLGLKNTNFDNPVGLDKGNGYNKIYCTAADFAVLSRKAMTYSTIRKIAKTAKHKVPKCNKKPAITIKNTNCFYSSYSYDKKKYSVIGLKTGSTTAAKYTMVVVGRDKNHHEVICTYFGATSNYGRYTGISKLMDHTFKMAASGKVVLHKDYWDTRYSPYAALIRKYADSGVLTAASNGKFYPKKSVSGKQFALYLAKISGVKMTFANDTVTIEDFVKAYNEYKSANETADSLKKSGILPSDIGNDVNAAINKGQAVYIAAKVTANAAGQSEAK